MSHSLHPEAPRRGVGSSDLPRPTTHRWVLAGGAGWRVTVGGYRQAADSKRVSASGWRLAGTGRRRQAADSKQVPASGWRLAGTGRRRQAADSKQVPAGGWQAPASRCQPAVGGKRVPSDGKPPRAYAIEATRTSRQAIAT